MSRPRLTFLESSLPYAVNAARLIVMDRGMFVADFFLATTVPFLMQFLIWSYLYQGSSISRSFGVLSLSQTLFYYAFSIAFGRLNNGYDVVSNLSLNVREGTLEPHLLRPVPYPLQKLADFMGGGVVYSVPIILVLAVFVFIPPVALNSFFWPGWVLLVVVSQILCFTLSWTVAMMSLWLVRTDFALSLLTTSAAFFGGELLPPYLWPEWLRPLMSYNPFRFMISAPAQAIVTMDGGFVMTALAWTSFYAIAFGCLSAFLWRQGMKRYRGAGG